MMRAWLLVVILAVLPSVALAQDLAEGGPSYDPWALPATVAEVEDLCQQAGVSAEGMGAARALVEGCEATLNRDRHRMDRAVEKAWMTRTQEQQAEIQEEMNKAMERRTASYREASKVLMSDLRAIMPKDSDAAWAAFERRRHRRLYSHQTWRMGVAVDLIELAQTEKIDTTQEARDVLESYELDYDRLLMARVPLATEYERLAEKVTQNGDTGPIEKAYNDLRDADCAILRLQRATAQKLINTLPEDKRGGLRDKLLTARWANVATNTPLRSRAEKLVKSGRLEKDKRATLEEGIRAFDEKSRALDDKHLTSAEDAECTKTYQEALNAGGDQGDVAWYDESRKLQAELLAVVERVATEDDLDSVADDR
jgi:hypothetical protein